MNSDQPEGKGGAPYHPTARKSIHQYRVNSLITNETMGRYGINKSNKQIQQDAKNESNEMDAGEDVVDNVMSKMSRQTSPLSIRKRVILRSNSYSQDEENNDDTSDDSNIEEENSLTKSRTEDESFLSAKNRSNRSTDYSQLSPSPYQRKLSVSSRDNTQAQSSNSIRNISILTLVLGIIAVVVHWKFPNIISNNSQDKSTQTVNHDKIIFENNMKILQEKYNIDDDSILQLKTGISTIFSRMDTGSFMFLYNSKTNNFNAVKFEKFTDEVAYTAARYLRHDISSIQHTVVESSDLDMQEHGELITRYRNDVDRSGVMLVKEIDAVPSDLAMAFHYYCDEYDPLVKRSAIFFTLNKANCSNTSDPKSMHDFVEKCLARKWKTVPKENMRPLLTRVVDVVIDVTSVF